MHRLIRFAIFAALLLVVGMGASECDDTGADDVQREKSIKARTDTFARAEAKVPLPRTNNFPLRSLLAEMTRREDLPNHPWYTYLLGEQGNVVGYYVSKTVPVNKCNFLSSTEKVKNAGYDDNAAVLLQAPSLDGIYYGKADCNVWVMQDYSTGALISFGGVPFTTADKPLNLDAEPIKVER